MIAAQNESAWVVRLKLKRVGQCLLLVILFIVFAIGGYAGYLIAGHNLHVVEPGQVYRSSRMSPAALTQVIQAHGIKSVLSLIGWNHAESDTAQRLDVQYFEVSLSDRHEVTDAQFAEILAIIRCAPRPLLIHCKAGADRAGLVASLYRYAIEGQPAAVADQELTIRYGHLPPCLGFETSAMDRSFWRYVGGHASGSAANGQ